MYISAIYHQSSAVLWLVVAAGAVRSWPHFLIGCIGNLTKGPLLLSRTAQGPQNAATQLSSMASFVAVSNGHPAPSARGSVLAAWQLRTQDAGDASHAA